MRNPRRVRNIAALLSLLGALAFVLMFVTDVPVAVSFQSVIGIVGLAVAPVGAVVAVSALFDTLRQERLLGGEGALARWTLDPAYAQMFVGFSIRQTGLPREGIEVVLGKDGVMVDGDFKSLPANGLTLVNGPYWIEGPHPCLEFRLWAANTTGSSKWSLRIPIAPGRENDAVRVCEYYHARRPPPRQRNLPRFRNIALIIAVVGGMAFGIAISMRERQDLQIPLIITAISGAMLGIASLILALVCHLSIRRP